MMLTVSDIVQQLVQAHKEGRDVNLNKYDIAWEIQDVCGRVAEKKNIVSDL